MDHLRVRILLALIIAFLLSGFFKRQIFMDDTPKISDTAKLNVINLPKYLAQSSDQFLTMVKSRRLNQPPSPTPTPLFLAPMPWSPSKNNNIGSSLPTSQPIIPSWTGNIVPSPTIIPTVFIPTPTDVLPTEPNQVYPTPTNLPPTVAPTRAPTAAPNLTLKDFGRCLTANGMKEYVQPGCSACSQQQKILGEAANYVTSINCEDKPQECGTVGVRMTPTWARNGKIVIPGVASLDLLGTVSGCQVPR